MARRSFIAKTFGMLIGLPVAIVIVLFAISNRHAVEVGFWPLPITVEVPAYILGLCTMAFGFVLGTVVAWFSGGSTRRRARVAEGKARRLEHDLDVRSHEVDDLRKALPSPDAR
ncbi:LapA family protein [Nisaea acidiphila]|uniref:LapA family protein n=1 Tax=Nisaea acidiphila TaxID=1862145 RepID=A0A9J7AWU8_9PROT|nr:LapA family protein [Nisaea acidiphila]UUX51768.1 LapA family protein [Nisaea acidiphila]